MSVEFKSTKTRERRIALTNTLELEAAIARSGYSKREVARMLNLSDMGLYKKIHNITEFKASEIMILVTKLNIEKVGVIFFDNKEDLKSTEE